MLRITPFLFFIFLACDIQQPFDKSFVLAYAELRLAEREYGETEQGKLARFQILQKYNIDQPTFEEKMENIKSKNESWLEFQKMMVGILDSINNGSKE